MRWTAALLFLLPASALARDLAVHPESRAYYSVDEDFLAGKRTVRGTNEGVTGAIAWNDSAGGLVFPATIYVDAAGFKTEIKARDKKVRGSILDATTHPKITFTLTSCDPPLAKPLPAKTIAKGTLEIHGQKKEIEMPVDVGPSADQKTVTVSGRATAKLADFGLVVPVVPLIARAHDDVTFEISLVIDAP